MSEPATQEVRGFDSRYLLSGKIRALTADHCVINPHCEAPHPTYQLDPFRADDRKTPHYRKLGDRQSQGLAKICLMHGQWKATTAQKNVIASIHISIEANIPVAAPAVVPAA